MKNLFICATTFLLFVSCNKPNLNITEVEVYINTLKEDKTQTIENHNFGSENISELLNYSTDKFNIINFPRNPLSSIYIEEVTLGMYVLWIIESIRMKEINDPGYYLFASLNPRIIRLSSGELLDQEIILPEVALAYFEWWNSSLVLEDKLRTNPLEGLDLSWN